MKLYFTASVAVAVTEICPDPSPLGFWVVDPIISISIWRFDGYIFSGLSISSIDSPLPEPEQDTSSAKIEKIKNLLKRPDYDYSKVSSENEKSLPYYNRCFFEIETSIKYDGYIENEKERIEKNKKLSKNLKLYLRDVNSFGTNKSQGALVNKIIDQYKTSKKSNIINLVPNQSYCLAGYWIEELSPGTFQSIFYEKSIQRITEYNDMKKRVDKFINDINSEYKSIKKEINDLF